jgi:hypothetical protein
VLFLEDLAKKLDAQKKDGATARSTIQRTIKLTDQEAAALKALAAHWQTQLTANRAAAEPLFKAAQSQVAASGAASAALVQQFQTGVGSARFALIDAAVRASSTVLAVKIPPQSAPAGSGGNQ